jgi:predicted RNA binding protein YcfA (HicA-like mRNA interferase family)
LKALSGKEFVRLLERNGWTLERIQGSHHIFIKQGWKVRVSVPVHENRPLKIGL